MMSIVGNVIFSPILFLFLIISSLVFFTELCCIPNTYLIYVLNIITQLWEKMLLLGSKKWLVPFCKQHSILLLVIPIITIMIICHKKINSIHKRIVILSTILLASVCIFAYNTSFKQSIDNSKIIVEKNSMGTVDITDCGLFSRKKSVDTFIGFEFRPYIIKNFGTLDIRTLILSKPNISSFKAACGIAKTFSLEQVIVNTSSKKLKKYEWKCFFDMKEEVEKHNVVVVQQ